MRHLLSIAILLLCIASGGVAVPESREKVYKKTQTPYVSTSKSRYETEEWKPIRIAVNLGGVLDDINNCEQFRDTSSSYGALFRVLHPTYDFAICKKLEGLNVDGAVEFFKKNVVEAIRLHADRLMVKRVDGNLRVLNDDQYAYHGPCRGVMPPIEDKESHVRNADVVLYLSLTSRKPITEVCRYDEHGRPVAANIRLRPGDLLRHEAADIRFLAHHIAHAIGFDSILKKTNEMTPSEGDGKISQVLTIGDRSMANKLTEIFECGKRVSVIKMERNGKSKKHLHFPSSFVEVELMSPHDMSATGLNETVYSALTLAVFESTGHFKADFDRDEIPESWKMTQRLKICRAQEE